MKNSNDAILENYEERLKVDNEYIQGIKEGRGSRMLPITGEHIVADEDGNITVKVRPLMALGVLETHDAALDQKTSYQLCALIDELPGIKVLDLEGAYDWGFFTTDALLDRLGRLGIEVRGYFGNEANEMTDKGIKVVLDTLEARDARSATIPNTSA